MDKDSGTSVCLIRVFDAAEYQDQAILNEFDCPLLTLSDQVIAVPPSHVMSAVSVCHECTDSCVFKKSGSRRVERETVEATNRLSYKHDWLNRWFSLNIFCMSQ